jgi:hypothetical protein
LRKYLVGTRKVEPKIITTFSSQFFTSFRTHILTSRFLRCEIIRSCWVKKLHSKFPCVNLKLPSSWKFKRSHINYKETRTFWPGKCLKERVTTNFFFAFQVRKVNLLATRNFNYLLGCFWHFHFLVIFVFNGARGYVFLLLFLRIRLTFKNFCMFPGLTVF